MAQGVGVGFADEMRNVQREISDSMATVSLPDARVSGRGRDSSAGGQTVVNQYIQAVPMTPAELARQSRDAFDRLRWT